MMTITNLQKALSLLLPYYNNPMAVVVSFANSRSDDDTFYIPKTDKKVPEEVAKELNSLGFYDVGGWEY